MLGFAVMIHTMMIFTVDDHKVKYFVFPHNPDPGRTRLR